MSSTKRWSIEVILDEQDGHTRAEARLHTGDRTDVRGMGRARLNPIDEDIPEIGDELAVARALADLGHRLIATAARDIEGVTHVPAHLDS
jgi:hypothetical protein